MQKFHLPVLLCLFAALLAAGLVSGCRGTRETYYGEEEDFFVPIDTTLQDSSKRFLNAMQPGAVEFQEGNPGKPAGDFDPLLTDADVVISERLTPDAMADSLNLVGSQVAYLQNILEASTIDPRMYYHSQVKSWTINNPALRDSLFYALLAIDSSMQSEAGSDAQILATESNDLIEARFGTSVFKGTTLKRALEKSSDKFLAYKIIQSGGYSRDVELRDTNFAIPTPLEPEILPRGQMMDRFIGLGPRKLGLGEISLFGASLRIGSDWGAAFKMGNEELGLPFWSSGNMSFFVTYKRLKVGAQLPLRMGKKGGDNFPLFAIRNRRLVGTRGIAAEADFGNLGGYISSSRITSNDVVSIPDKSAYYYITSEFIGYYSFAFSVNHQNFLRIKVGGGVHRIVSGAMDPPLPGGRMTETASELIGAPFIAAEYLHEKSSERFGGGLQVYDLQVLTNAWLDIIPHTLRLELKYMKIISRPLRPWDIPDFIIVSPKYTFSF